MLQVTPQLVGRVYKEVRLLCSRDIIETPFYPFGGPNQVCKCDESKFQHKRKVHAFKFYNGNLYFISTSSIVPLNSSYCMKRCRCFSNFLIEVDTVEPLYNYPLFSGNPLFNRPRLKVPKYFSVILYFPPVYALFRGRGNPGRLRQPLND